MTMPPQARAPLGEIVRAYSVFEIKSVDQEKRIITGIATTPTTDSYDDIVESDGAQFKLPLPLLWQHNADQPIGHVTAAKVSKTGITVTAQLADIAEPGTLKDRLDEAWQAIKYGLVKGFSIGFRPLETAQIEGTWGYRYLKWAWLELSAVTIPANMDCSIQTIKSIDIALLAASGKQQSNVDRKPPSAGVSATKQSPVVKAQEAKHMPKPIAEQIKDFQTTRATKAARMSEIMDGAAERGETLDQASTEEYDGLEAEVKAVDEHLVRLERHQKANVAKAVEVPKVTDPQPSVLRIPASVKVARTVAPGIGFTRFCLAVARSKGNLMQAERMIEQNEQWMAETPDLLPVIRAAVNAGTTTDSAWAGPLVQYQNLASEFIEYLRPLTLIGKIAGLRYVPFKVKIPRQTGTSTANWVGEGQAKPVSALAFDSVTLDITTISDIVIFSQQLAQLSQPSVEMLVRDDLAKKIINFMDAQFIDPTVAVSGTTSPASISNGVTPTVATGTTADALRTDVGTLFEGFLEANLQLNDACWIMSQVTAARINLIRSNLGLKEYPEINVNGGFFEGLPVYVSQSVPATGGSPTDGYPIFLVNAGDILIADDGQIRVDASSEASLQMDTAPDSPTTGSTTLISLWQQGYMGIKADRDVNWVKRRSTSVAYISSAKYTTD